MLWCKEIGAAQDSGGALSEARLELLSRIIVFELGGDVRGQPSFLFTGEECEAEAVSANILSNRMVLGPRFLFPDTSQYFPLHHGPRLSIPQ